MSWLDDGQRHDLALDILAAVLQGWIQRSIPELLEEIEQVLVEHEQLHANESDPEVSSKLKKSISREQMVYAFQRAFEHWSEYDEAVLRLQGSVTRRGEDFAAILDKLSKGKPWSEIGK